LVLLKEITPTDMLKEFKNTLNGGAAMHPSITFKTLKLLRNPHHFENKSNLDFKRN